KSIGFQSELDDLGPNSGAIAKRDANTWFFPAHAPTRDGNRGYLVDHEHDYEQEHEARGLAKQPARSERLDVGFFSQAGEPAFLNLLGFVLDQLFLYVRADFGKRLRAAAVFIFDLQDVIIAGVIDDVTDSVDRHAESEFFQRLGQGLVFDPAPV